MRMARTLVRAHVERPARKPPNHCFACGEANPQGMHLKFFFDRRNRRVLCRFTLSRRYSGPPGFTHGGIIATILDEVMAKVNKLRGVIALTAEMQIEYLKPVPLGRPLVAESKARSARGRRYRNHAEIRNRKGEVLARGHALFIEVDPQRMFAKYLKAGRGRQALPANVVE